MTCFLFLVWRTITLCDCHTTSTQTGSGCRFFIRFWATTTGRLLGFKDTAMATASRVEPRLRNLSITSSALYQLAKPRLHLVLPV